MEKFHNSHAQGRVLVIESDALMLTAIGAALDMQGHRVTLARTEQVAQSALSGGQIDLIILSIEQLETGCQFAQRLRSDSTNRDIPIIFIVPQLTNDWAARLQAQGGVYCILNTLDPHDLLDLVDKALWMPHLAQRKAPHFNSSEQSNAHSASDWLRLEQ